MLSRTSLGRLLDKIDSGSVSKDRKIETSHGLLEQQQTVCTLETICSEAWQKVSQASGISEW